MAMTISSNQQITFWLNGVESYNVENAASRTRVRAPYYLPANREDELRVQIKDTILRTYRLRCVDCDGTVLGTLSFTATLVGDTYVYDILTTFLSMGVVSDQKVLLQIIDSVTSSTISGGVTEPAHIVSGTIVSADITFTISGGVTEPSHGVSGEIIGVLSELFSFGASPAGSCGTLDTTLYYDASLTLVPGTPLFTDIGLTTPALDEVGTVVNFTPESKARVFVFN